MKSKRTTHICRHIQTYVHTYEHECTYIHACTKAHLRTYIPCTHTFDEYCGLTVQSVLREVLFSSFLVQAHFRINTKVVQNLLRFARMSQLHFGV